MSQSAISRIWRAFSLQPHRMETSNCPPIRSSSRSASWLNQVERFLGLLTDRRIRRGSSCQIPLHGHHGCKPLPQALGSLARIELAGSRAFVGEVMNVAYCWISLLAVSEDGHAEHHASRPNAKGQDSSQG